MKYLLTYKIIYVILLFANLMVMSIPYKMDDFGKLMISYSLPYFLLSVYNLFQIKNRTVKPWVYIIERTLSIGGMIMIALMIVPAGVFIAQLGPIFVIFWGTITKIFTSSTGEITVTKAIFFHLVTLITFLLEYYYFVLLGRHKQELSTRN